MAKYGNHLVPVACVHIRGVSNNLGVWIKGVVPYKMKLISGVLVRIVIRFQEHISMLLPTRTQVLTVAPGRISETLCRHIKTVPAVIHGTVSRRVTRRINPRSTVGLGVVPPSCASTVQIGP